MDLQVVHRRVGDAHADGSVGRLHRRDAQPLVAVVVEAVVAVDLTRDEVHLLLQRHLIQQRLSALPDRRILIPRWAPAPPHLPARPMQGPPSGRSSARPSLASLRVVYARRSPLPRSPTPDGRDPSPSADDVQRHASLSAERLKSEPTHWLGQRATYPANLALNRRGRTWHATPRPPSRWRPCKRRRCSGRDAASAR